MHCPKPAKAKALAAFAKLYDSPPATSLLPLIYLFMTRLTVSRGVKYLSVVFGQGLPLAIGTVTTGRD